MSSRSSLILTNDNEHWYEETNEPRYDKEGKFIGWDIEIEIDDKNIVYQSRDDGLMITIKGDSHLAKILRHYLKNVKELNLARVGVTLPDGEYWKQRCVLSEKIESENPCDPDITTEQIQAYTNYQNFLIKHGNR